VVDQLAQDYAGQPVIFLEYDVDNAPSSRNSRFWAAHGGGSVTLPEVMVDSGNQISSGYVDFYNVYKGMVDIALGRQAQADIKTYWLRTGNRVSFSIRVTNLSDVTLSSGDNSAMVHALVYEDVHVHATNRFVRATVSTSISSLTPNDTATYTLETPELSGVDWDKLHFVALVDYRPAGSSGAYDILQATLATPLKFVVQPNTLVFMVDPTDLVRPSASVSFESPDFLNWTAVTTSSWIVVTPISGVTMIHPTISVIANTLSAGWQQGTITFATTEGSLEDQVLVRTYYGVVKRTYLPIVIR